MNILKSNIKELVQHFKMQKKYPKYTCEYTMYNPLTSQNSSPVGISLSGIVFNLTSLLTNEWTPPLKLKKIEKSYWWD